MKKLLAAAVALGAFAVSAPAFASHDRYDDRYVDRYDYERHGGRDSIRAMQDRIYRDLEIGMRTGQLSYREAGRLRAEFAHIDRLAYRYSRNGFDRWERNEVLARLDRLSDLIRWERFDRNDHRG